MNEASVWTTELERCWNESSWPVKNVITNCLSGMDTWWRGPNSRRPVTGLPLNGQCILLEQGAFYSYGRVKASKHRVLLFYFFFQTSQHNHSCFYFTSALHLGGQICCMMHVKWWHLSKQVRLWSAFSCWTYIRGAIHSIKHTLADLKASSLQQWLYVYIHS